MMTTDSALPAIQAVLLNSTEANIQQCAKALLAGQLVAFPTETVFGLGAAVTQTGAVRNIFKAKGRPSEHPLIAHVAPGVSLQGWVGQVTPVMQKLMDAFWPGPLTLVVPKGPLMPFEVTGGQNSVGIRCPSHPVAIQLLGATGVPVAAPSANRFGKVSPTRASHVMSELGDRIPYVLDGDIPEIGIESTIVSLLGATPAILRPGAITADDLEAVLGVPVKRHADAQKNADANPRVSGALEKHYSPNAKVLVVSASQLAEIQLNLPALVAGWSTEFLNQARNLSGHAPGFTVHSIPPSPGEAGKTLYTTLRLADELGCNQMIFEKPPATPEWEAVADRLKRAAA